jgi:predicted transcriptional regulator
MSRTWTRKPKEEIVKIILEALNEDPQSVEKIVKKTGLNWRTVKEYLFLIRDIQSTKRIRVTEDPILAWYPEEKD